MKGVEGRVWMVWGLLDAAKYTIGLYPDGCSI